MLVQGWDRKTWIDSILYVYENPKYHEFYKIYYFRMFIKLVGIMADRIISVSESTLRDFISLTGTAKDKISLIYLGSNKWPAPLFTPGAIEKVKKKYGIKGEYLLFIGTIEPRKNIVRLIKAYHKTLKHHKNFKLVIVGMKGWGYSEVFKTVNRLGLWDRIVFAGFVDNESSIKVFRSLIHTSLYPLPALKPVLRSRLAL